MHLLTASVPIWASILFILTFPAVIFLIANTARAAAARAGLPQGQRTRLWWGIVEFYTAFLTYTTGLSWSGTFDALTLPPPIFLYTTIPLLLIYFGYVFRTKLFRALLKNASLDSLIRIHLFRFVGVFFLINLYYEALPQRFALIAGIGDILTATLAIWVAREVAQRTRRSYRLALIWNIIGLWDIISVIISGLLTARQATMGHADALRLVNMANVPFCWIPALAPATIIFLHVGVFNKLKTYRNELAAGTLATPLSAPLVQ